MTVENQKCIVRLLTEARVQVAAARFEVSNCSSRNTFDKPAHAPQCDRSSQALFAQEQK